MGPKEIAVLVACYDAKKEESVMRKVLNVDETTEAYITVAYGYDNPNKGYGIVATLVGLPKELEQAVKKIQNISYNQKGKRVLLIKDVKVL